jgi:hypothetical protein
VSLPFDEVSLAAAEEAAAAAIRRIRRQRWLIGGITRVLVFVAGFGAVAVASAGVEHDWTVISLGAGAVTFGLAALPGFELVSGLALLAVFGTVVLRIYLLTLSVPRALAIGMLLLLWALLTQLAESLVGEPATRPVRVPVDVWLREGWPLLAVGTVAGLASAAVASITLRIGGIVGIALAATAPAILLLALVFAWRWRDPGNHPPPPDVGARDF